MAGPDATPPEGLDGYVTQLFASEDEILRDLREAMAERGLPEIYISAQQGRLLQVLLSAIGARRVLEIGTLGGYSAIWMARALPADGYLLSLEVERERAELAREFIGRAGLDAVAEVRLGTAESILEELLVTEERFDAAFIDADKERYPLYLERALELVRPGGLILGDNAFRDGRITDDPPPDEGTAAMQRFNAKMAGTHRLISTIIPVRDGLAVGVVR